MKPLSAQLREGTHELHERLDRSLPLMRPGLTRAEYVAFLSRMLAWLEPTEQRLASALNHLVAVHRRAGRLETDLAALGEPLPASAGTAALPPLATEADALGCFYVLEGSALGGQIVSRHVERTLGLDARTGAAYFNGDGAATGSRWRAVCRTLDAYPAGPAPAVVDGANGTFRSLLSWLT